MLSVIIYCAIDSMNVDEFFGFLIMECCVIGTLSIPFFNKKRWNGFKGYWRFLYNAFFNGKIEG